MHTSSVQEKVIIVGLSISIAFAISVLGLLTNNNLVWLGLLIGLLFMLFLNERIKLLRGEELFWMNFTSRDKFIYCLDLVILLTSLLYPIKEGFSITMIFVILLAGMIFAWLLTYLFATDKVKGKVFGIKF